MHLILNEEAGKKKTHTLLLRGALFGGSALRKRKKIITKGHSMISDGECRDYIEEKAQSGGGVFQVSG